MVLGAIFPDIKINDRLDFTTSWLDSPLGILIPIPEASTNYTALLQPFRYQVTNLYLVSVRHVELCYDRSGSCWLSPAFVQ